MAQRPPRSARKSRPADLKVRESNRGSTAASPPPTLRDTNDARRPATPEPVSTATRRALVRRTLLPAGAVTVPVLADGADPGKTMPSPMAIRDRLVVDGRLVGDHQPDRLFAYEVTRDNLPFLAGLASPGDRIVFRRGGRTTADRICAVRTPRGVVLARVEFSGHSLVLLPAPGARDTEPIKLPIVRGLPGVVAGTHILLIRR